ncbi:MAG: adenylate cyclase [Parasphingorhabdus sp.]
MNTDQSDILRDQKFQLAAIREALQAPAHAIQDYAELLIGAADEHHLEDVVADLQRVAAAANNLSEQVDGLLDNNTADKILNSEDWKTSERTLRHDLRTPLNAVKGYTEMLLEDAEEFEIEFMNDDLTRLLNEADQLLGKIDTIVRFSQTENNLIDAHHSEVEKVGFMADLSVALDNNQSKVQSVEPGHILVVDDIESNRDLISRQLSRDGHQITCAEHGLQALEILDTLDIDLVLLDLMMPVLNGFETLKRMKASESLRNVPVIVISALDESDTVVKCIEAGADDYLLKPFNPVLLKARIRSGLENKHWFDEERQQKQFIRQAFSRFMSKTVVDQLVADPSKLSLGGERLNISSLFTDLTNFTTLIETTDPGKSIPLLNQYLDGLCKIVMQHEGTIDKIIGDAVHAIFGAPLNNDDHPRQAAQCAIAIDHYAREFRQRVDASEVNFGLTRIGVHSGEALVGNFGGETFFDYTAYGDVINTSARMESINKQLGTTICISGDTISHCPEIPVRPIGYLRLKGKNEYIQAFEPCAHYPQKLLQNYSELYQFLQTDKPTAEKLNTTIRQSVDGDPLSQFHLNRLDKGQTGTHIEFDAK